MYCHYKKVKLVYIPKSYIPARKDFFGNMTPSKQVDAVNPDILKRYFSVTDDPAKADFAIVFAGGPAGGPGYDKEDLVKGGNGYVPISLQYELIKQTMQGTHSIAAGDPVEPGIINVLIKANLSMPQMPLI